MDSGAQNPLIYQSHGLDKSVVDGQGNDCLNHDTGTAICDSEDQGTAQVQGHPIDKETESQYKPKDRPYASLYCPVSGYLHSNLLDFDVKKCPTCTQDLVETPRLSSHQVEPFPTVGGRTATHEHSSDEEEREKTEKGRIQHAVEYKDAGGRIIKVVEQSHPFNLDEERHNATAKNKQGKRGPILRVVTVLDTSVPYEVSAMWPSYQVDQLERDMEIIGNPKYDIAVNSRKLVILSVPFIKVLQEVCSYDTGRLFEAAMIELNEPYSVIAHHLDELEAHKQSLASKVADNAIESTTQDKEAYDDLGLVLDYVNVILQDPISHELARHAGSPAQCTYRMLWLLFKPGCTVYVFRDEKWDACVVDSVEMGHNVLSGTDEAIQSCRVNLWYLDFDGRYVTRFRTNATIQPFAAERSITSLKVIPSEYWDGHDNSALRERLESEGREWYRLLGGSQVNYSGELVSHGRNLKWLDGRVYVDTAAYYELEAPPGTVDSFQRVADDPDTKDTKFRDHWAGYDNIDTRTVKDLELPTDAHSTPNHRYLICARELKGFVFKLRTWETLDVASCKEPTLDRTPFDRLAMVEEQKLMIKALVYKYTDPRFAGSDSQQVWAADFIKNKGEGQIFLLHGGPGVGKTFGISFITQTAECIAEFTGRPLLAMTCGDLGTDEISLERELGKWLKLAHKWGAVMLIDEADVFLEKRMEMDIKRNSLVSVFLREIEYYQGILFLTTNRVGQFDDAFISRIHIVIHYPDLSDNYRRQIWNQFFDKLEEERADSITIHNSARRYVLEEPEMRDYKWNGREIRNAFQTAVALADYRYLTKPEMEKNKGEVAVLNQKDFKQVCEMTMKFKKYLADLHGGLNEQQRARLGGARRDDEETD